MTADPQKSDLLLLFGRILRKHRFVLPEDLDECLAIQQKLQLMGGSRTLGQVLVDQGYLTADHVTWVLNRQAGDAPLGAEETLFGDLTVRNGFAEAADVARALKAQRRTAKRGQERRLGDLLVSADVMTLFERDAILKLQRRLRGDAPARGVPAADSEVLLLEAERQAPGRGRAIAAALAAGLVMTALAALLAFAILR